MKEDQAPDKMRIRLLTKEGMVISDRLVNQSQELRKGPQEKHEGPFLIEWSFRDQEDIGPAKEYMDKLCGLLPLEVKTEKRGRHKKVSLLDKEPIKELYHTAINKCKTQEALIEYLRSLDFVFLTPQFIQDFKVPIKIKEKHDSLQFMVRAVKQAKNPKADKYDHQLAFGFKLVGKEATPMVKVYMYGNFYKTITLEWGKDSKRTLQKPDFLVFPTYMTEDERIKFSIEHRKRKLDKDLKISKLYSRWEPHVKTR